MSIFNTQIEFAEKIGAKLIMITSVYNYHIAGIPESKMSNLKKCLKCSI